MTQVAAAPRFERPRESRSCDRARVRQWLVNSWTTEKVLHASEPLLEDAGATVLQWAFPQCYYACFASTMAFFQTAGYTESSHTAVIRKSAELAIAQQYPAAMAFAVSGTKKNQELYGLTPHDHESAAIQFDPSDPGSVDLKIAQFLRSTHEHALDAKKKDLRLRTATGTVRKNLREEHWKTVAAKVGPTGLLALLYRKRIKANYGEIDAFTESGMNPGGVYQSLVRVSTIVSFVHECLIARALGDWYASVVGDWFKHIDAPFLEARRAVITELCREHS
ncbi:MAG: hypothetical protein RJQ04_04115 [Longimicrobiales bacterium]